MLGIPGLGSAGIDPRLPPPPIPLDSLAAYINTIASSATTLEATQQRLTQGASALVQGATPWIGDDSAAFQASFGRLGDEHVQPLLRAMDEIRTTLTTFHQGLRTVGEEATTALHVADKHLEYATEMENLTRVQLVDAMAGLPETAALVQALNIELDDWLEQQQQARMEQERAKEQARTGYAGHDAQAAGSLMGIQIPPVPAAQALVGTLPAAITGANAAGAALQGAFAGVPGAICDTDPVGMPPNLVGQASANTCLATGIQNYYAAQGVYVDGAQIAPLVTNPAGAKYDDGVRAMNAIAQLNGMGPVAFCEGLTIDDLRAITGGGQQVMVPIRTAIGGAHNVNVYGVQEIGGQPWVRLFDSTLEPHGEYVKLPASQFMQMWIGQRGVVPVGE